MTSADRETGTVRRLLEWRGWPELAAIGVLVLIAAYVAVTTVHMIGELALRTPFWDNWLDVIPEKFLARPFAQHNEHRPFVARLFLALDFRLFGGQGWFCLAANAVLLAGTAAMLAWAAGRGMPRVRATIFALGLTFLLSAYNWENLLLPFQIQMVSVVPSAVVAFIALTRQTPISGNVALLAAAAATYSGANGLLVPMLLVVLAALIGSPRRDVIVLSMFAVALLAAYLVGFDNVERRTPMSAFRDPRLFFRYVAVLLGAPLSWGYEERLLASEIYGVLGLVSCVAVLVTSVLKRRSMTPSDWVLPFVILFTVGSGAMMAIGRMYYSSDQALASRYGSITFLFWTALIAQIVRSAPPVLMRSGATVLACALAMMVASRQEETVTHVDSRLSKIRHAETALAAEALDVEAINLITFSPYLVRDTLATLKQRRWSIYREPWVAWLGTKLSDHVREHKARACAGAIEGVQAVASYEGPAYRFQGWAYSRRESKPAERVFFVDEHGIVLGFGRMGESRPDLKSPRRKLRSDRVGFVGHIGRLPRATVVVHAVALVNEGNTTCRLKNDVTLVRAEGDKLVKVLN